MQITIDVPDSLGQKLQQFGHRLPELLERGLQELQNEEQTSHCQDEQDIMALLVSQPSPSSGFWPFVLQSPYRRESAICCSAARRTLCRSRRLLNSNVTSR